MLELTQADFEELSRVPGISAYTFTAEERRSGTRTIYSTLSTRWIPGFAANDAQLQAVLLHTATRYAFRRRPVPTDFVATLDAVVESARERAAAVRQRLPEPPPGIRTFTKPQVLWHHLIAVERVGGRVAFMAAIAYRAWRLRFKHEDIAVELETTPAFVGGILRTLIRHAAELGFETYAPSTNKGIVRIDKDAVIALRKQNLSAKEISARTGHTPVRIRAVLRRAGFSTKWNQTGIKKPRHILRRLV